MSIGDESPRGETIDGKFRPHGPRCASVASRQRRDCARLCATRQDFGKFSHRDAFFSGMRTASTLKTGRKKRGIVQRDRKQKRVSQRLRRENLRASWSEKWSASANWTPAGTQVVMAVCGTAHTALGIIQKKKKKRKA